MSFEPILYGPLFVRDALDVNLVAASADPVEVTVAAGGASWPVPVTPVLMGGRYLAPLRMREILGSVVGIPGLADAGEREVPLVTLSAAGASMSFRAVYGAAAGKTPAQLAGHWLSWRNQVSNTYIWSRERLTFLAGLDLLGWQGGTYSVKAKVFLASGDPVTVTLASGTLQEGCRYVTVDASYATIAAQVSGTIRAWDVSYSFTRTDAQGPATIEGYPMRLVLSRQDVRVKEFVFCNSFGVEDRVYSSGRSNPKLEGASVGFLNGAVEKELRNDAQEGKEVFSGHLVSARESALWLDFLKAHERHILLSGQLARIVVNSQETDLQDNALGSVKFTYHLGVLDDGRYFDDLEGLGDYDPEQRYGALYVGDEPASEDLPTEDLFFLKTRLDEFPAADLDEELLFLVQNPLTLAWGNAPLSGIKDYLQRVITREDVHIWSGPWDDYSAGVAGCALAASLGRDLYDRVLNLETHPTDLSNYYTREETNTAIDTRLDSLTLDDISDGTSRKLSDYATTTALSGVSARVASLEERTNWDEYFDIVDGNIHVKGNRGFYGDSFVSAGGLSAGSGGGGIDADAMWALLLAPTSEQINASHLQTAFGTLNLGAAATYGVGCVSQGSNGLVTGGDVWSAIDALPEPMVFKGSLGTGGTITSLPTASSANEGFTYKVITAGTYQGITAKVGDTFISNGSTWVLIPSGDEPSGTVTSVKMSLPTGLVLGTGSTNPITTSGEFKVALDTGYSIPLAADVTKGVTAYGYFTNGVANSAARLSGNTAYSVWGVEFWANGVPKSATSRPNLYIGDAKVATSAQTSQNIGGLGNLTHANNTSLFWYNSPAEGETASAYHVLSLNAVNTLIMGYGTAEAGYYTVIDGAAVSLRYFNGETHSAAFQAGTTVSSARANVSYLNLLPNSNGGLNLGSSGRYWNEAYTKKIYLSANSYLTEDSNGNVYLTVASGKGFYTNGFVSAGGLSDSGGAPGTTLSAVWNSLEGNSDEYANHKINPAHLITTNTSATSGLIIGSGLSYNSNTRTLSATGAVTSVAGKTGAVTLVHSDLTDWATATAGFLTSAVTSLAGKTGAITIDTTSLSMSESKQLSVKANTFAPYSHTHTASQITAGLSYPLGAALLISSSSVYELYLNNNAANATDAGIRFQVGGTTYGELKVNTSGDLKFNGYNVITAAGGSMSNTNLVTNLNAEYLNGSNKAWYMKRGAAYTTNNTTNSYLKVATVTLTSTGTHDAGITLAVTSYGNYGNGILSLNYRKESGASTATSGMTFARWLARESRINPDDFIISYKIVDTNTSYVSLYVKESAAWKDYRFTMIDEGAWRGKADLWELLTANGTTNTYASIPSDETQVASVDDSVASKMVTARTLWGRSFDGTANVSGDMTGVGNSTHANNTYLYWYNAPAEGETASSSLVLGMNANNTLLLGWGTAALGYNTRIYGGFVALAYFDGTTRNDGFVVGGAYGSAKVNYSYLDVIPSQNGQRNLGAATMYWANTYSSKFYLTADLYFEVVNGNVHLHTPSGKGFYADGFISAGGLSDGGGTSGIDLGAMWSSLTNDIVSTSQVTSTTKIHTNRLPVISYSGGVTAEYGSTGSGSTLSTTLTLGINASGLATTLTNAGYKLTDHEYSVVTSSAAGLAPAYSSANQATSSSSNTYYFLGWTGSTLKWYSLPANAFNDHTYSFSNADATLAWGTRTKIATTGGTDIYVTMPANPNTNTWRNIYTGGTSRVGTGTDTKAINFAAGTGITISYEAAGTGSGQSGSANYFNVKIGVTADTYAPYYSPGYVKKDGDTMSGALTISKSGTSSLIINRTDNTPFITFQSNGTTVGFIGASSDNQPYFHDTTQARKILTDNNYSSVLGTVYHPYRGSESIEFSASNITAKGNIFLWNPTKAFRLTLNHIPNTNQARIYNYNGTDAYDDIIINGQIYCMPSSVGIGGAAASGFKLDVIGDTRTSGKLYIGTSGAFFEYNTTNGVHLYVPTGKGLYTEGFISAGGVSSGGGTSGIDETAMWNLLANTDSTHQINSAHLTTALGSYVAKSGSTMSGALTISKSGTLSLVIDRTDNSPLITFKQDGTTVGYIGVSSTSVPIFYDTTARTIYHSGNFVAGTNYMPMTGGRISNALIYGLYLRNTAAGASYVGIRFEVGETLYGSLAVGSDSVLSYNGNTVYHAGNFTPGNYLLLAGGTMTLNSITDFTIKKTSNQYALICFHGLVNNADTALGYLGIAGVDNPVFVTSGSTYNTLFHTGNYTSYVNTTNFPGLDKTGTVTSITLKAGSGIALDTDNTAITTSGTRTISLAKTYAGGTAVTLNGTSKAETTASFYAPISAGTSMAQLCVWDATNSRPTWLTANKGSSTQPIYLNAGVPTACDLSSTYHPYGGGAYSFTASSLTLSSSAYFNNSTAIYFKNVPAEGESVKNLHSLALNQYNNLLLGWGTAGEGYETNIYGLTVRFYYGSSRTHGMVMNSSGGVTIGASNIAGSSYKLYVTGNTYIDGGISGATAISASTSITTPVLNLISDSTPYIYVTQNSAACAYIPITSSGLTYHSRVNNAWTADFSITASTGSITMCPNRGSVIIGSNTDCNLLLKRNSANYIWADTAGGYLVFGVKDSGAAGTATRTLTVNQYGIGVGKSTNGVIASSSYALNVTGATYMSAGLVVAGDAVSFGNSSNCVLYFKRPLINYLVADQTGGYFVFRVNGSATNVMTLSTNGQLSLTGNIVANGAVTAGSASDLRLKQNIKEMSSKYAMDIVMNAKPVTFEWNALATSLYDQLKGNDLGLVAQYEENHLPMAVTPIFEKYKRIDYSKYVSPLLKVAQNHETRLQAAERKIEALERENEDLRNRLNMS